MNKKYLIKIADHIILFIAVIALFANVFVFLNTEIYNWSGIAGYNDRMAYEINLGGDYCQNIKEPLGGLALFGIMFPFGFFMIQLLAIFIASMQIAVFFRHNKIRRKISVRSLFTALAVIFLLWISCFGILYIAIPAVFFATCIFYKYSVFAYREEELAIGIALMFLSWMMLLGAWMGVDRAFYYCAENANPFF